jgi:bacterioferritin-associated ferredoxin
MYVCICNAVTDRTVAEVIEEGAETRCDVTRACGAGGDCGSCHQVIDGMLEARREGATGPALVAASALHRVRAA